jgi:hypothetical protein
MPKYQRGWAALAFHHRPWFDNFQGINEDGNWGTFKTRTAEIVRRPDQIGASSG